MCHAWRTDGQLRAEGVWKEVAQWVPAWTRGPQRAGAGDSAALALWGVCVLGWGADDYMCVCAHTHTPE